VSNFSSADTERLLELLGREHELYKKIQELTQEQATLLAKDDIEEFNNALDRREELIEEIKGLHQESDTLMQSYTTFVKNGNEKNDGIDKLKGEIRELIKTCVKLNDESIMLMREKTEDQSRKIDEASSKRKGIGGYAQSVPNTPEMFDKKS